MSNFLNTLNYWLGRAYQSSWTWVKGLERDEWLLLLVAATVIGFCCMRGFGSRSSY